MRHYLTAAGARWNRAAFTSSTSATNLAFSVENNAAAGDGIFAEGGISSGISTGGAGVVGSRGNSNGGGSTGGSGVAGSGRDTASIGDYGGPGGRSQGGGSTTLGVGGGDAVGGNLSKSGGSFLIDHLTDPANKYLYHSFVESPDMMNIYNGNIVTDAGGTAIVTMPDWFEALNRDLPVSVDSHRSTSPGVGRVGSGQPRFHHQDRQGECQGLLAGHRHPARRVGQRPPHPA